MADPIRTTLERPTPQPLSPSAQAADDSTLRDAALLALTTLEGWSNYDQWVWPISAKEQVRRGTTEAIAALRMALSRFAPPTEGEVAELAAWLHDCADVRMDEGYEEPAFKFARAAELLRQQNPTPVPVSERPWEREGWCDDEGRCWIHCPGQSWDTWVLTVPQNAIDGAHCLPAHALPLPLPQGEDSNG